MSKITELQDEQEKIIWDFIQGMNEWLEVFNNYADKLMKSYERMENKEE